MTTMTLEELAQSGELDLGHSDWVQVDERHIELFADATGDHQWIHVDPEAAAKGPFGTTVAHGYLSLSLIPALLADLLTVSDGTVGINYGIDKVRFTAPVPSGSRVRLHAVLRSPERRGESVLYRLGVEIELEGGGKPALVGDVLYLAA